MVDTTTRQIGHPTMMLADLAPKKSAAFSPNLAAGRLTHLTRSTSWHLASVSMRLGAIAYGAATGSAKW